jgi:hypothetical protein
MKFYPEVDLSHEERELADICERSGNRLILQRSALLLLSLAGYEFRPARTYIGLPERNDGETSED